MQHWKRLAAGILACLAVAGLGYTMYEMNQELRNLQSDMAQMNEKLMQETRTHAMLEQLLKIEKYKRLGVQWLKTHPHRVKTSVWKRVKLSAYVADCKEGCSGKTATGYRIKNAKTDRIIAVDPSVIPLYSVVEIEGMGTFLALDTGGSIKGHAIDLLVDNVHTAKQIGVRHVRIRIVKMGGKHRGVQESSA